MATTNVALDPQWYHDAGCNHQFASLNVREEDYISLDQLKVGNDQGLHILHSGTATLSSSHHNFRLSFLLHLPQINKNLISVNQFTHDNGVFVEFHPNCYFVKGLRSRKLLFRGLSRNEIYQLPFSHFSSNELTAYIGEKVPMDDCHH
jgi:hypothetical protein